jgi:hypothetical protein
MVATPKLGAEALPQNASSQNPDAILDNPTAKKLISNAPPALDPNSVAPVKPGCSQCCSQSGGGTGGRSGN